MKIIAIVRWPSHLMSNIAVSLQVRPSILQNAAVVMVPTHLQRADDKMSSSERRADLITENMGR
jgi:hypothetical protein